MIVSTDSWLPRGFEFLSGLPESRRRRRQCMVIQVFADDSGSKNQNKYMFMVGLVSDSESWAKFSDEWTLCLRTAPSLRTFKMQHAASFSGDFRGWTGEQRDNKLKDLASVINRYAKFEMSAGFELEAHARDWEGLVKSPVKDSYFWGFYNLILGCSCHLWEIGLRERFEMVFDEQRIFGPRFKRFYPVVREAFRQLHPNEYTIMPVEPLFKTDDEFLPIQAADLFAWCRRRNADNPSEGAFKWLKPLMNNVLQSPYSSFFDSENMKRISRMGPAVVSESVNRAIRDIYGDD